MSEVANVFNDFGNSLRESEEGKPNCMKVLLEIDDSVTKYCINSLKDRLLVKGRGVVATCSGGDLSSDNKALYELYMSRGRNTCKTRVFSLSGEISGCAIDLLDGAQFKCKP